MKRKFIFTFVSMITLYVLIVQFINNAFDFQELEVDEDE